MRRLPVHLTVVALLATTQAAQAQTVPPPLPSPVTYKTASFSTSTADFFGAGGLTGRYLGQDCLDWIGGQQICAEVVVETGIESATGVGAIRTLISRLTSTADLPPGSWGVTQNQLWAGYLGGTVVRASAPGVSTAFTYEFLSALSAERVTRNSEYPFEGSFLFETYVPMSATVPLVFQYRDWYPVICSLNAVCTTDFPVRIASFANVTAVPEPSTYALLGTGLLTLGGIAARRRKRADA